MWRSGGQSSGQTFPITQSDLSASERAEHISLRKSIWEIRNADNSGGQSLATRSSGKLKTTGPQHQKQFAAETAAVANAQLHSSLHG